MDIVVLGAGAMGCRFGAELSRAGHDVLLADPWVEHVRAVRDRGLVVESDLGPERIRLAAETVSDCTARPDLLLVFGKATQTGELIRAGRHLVAEHTVALTLQNGLGNVEALGEVVPADRLLAGTTTIGTELLGPGRIRALGDGDTYVTRSPGSATEVVTAAFADSAIRVQVSSDVQAMIWSKVAFNCVMNPLATLLNCAVSDLAAHPDFEAVARAVVDEVVAVAACEGVGLDARQVMASISRATDPAESGQHLPSMLQDLLAGRPTEIDHLNGAVAARGLRHGVPVPHNTQLRHLVRMAEANRSTIRS